MNFYIFFYIFHISSMSSNDLNITRNFKYYINMV